MSGCNDYFISGQKRSNYDVKSKTHDIDLFDVDTIETTSLLMIDNKSLSQTDKLIKKNEVAMVTCARIGSGLVQKCPYIYAHAILWISSSDTYIE